MKNENLKKEDLEDNPVKDEIFQSNPPGDPAGGASEEKVPSALEELQKEYEDLNKRHLLLAADFDNYKKRTAKEGTERTTSAVANLATDVLGVVDNLERALSADDASLREGLDKIHKEATKILRQHDITPMKCINEPFDPSRQEALAYIPSDSEEGIVVDEIIRGYYMKDRVIRCAKVAVSKGNNKEE